MKKIKYILLLFSSLILSSCFDDKDLVFDETTLVEFAESVTRTPAAGRTYPLIAVNRGTGTQTTVINLVGKQKGTDETIKVSVESSSTTATEGVHYRLVNSGNATISANSSTGNFQIEILSVPAQAGTTVDVVVILEGNGNDIKPSENYKRIGYRINLN